MYMRVVAGRLERTWVKTPVAVPPSATQFAVGDGVVSQQVPRAVRAEPPSEVTSPPMVAVEVPRRVTVGEATVGVFPVVNESSAEVVVAESPAPSVYTA